MTLGLQGLLDLWRLDRRIRSLEEDLASFPREEGSRKRRLEEARAKRDRTHEVIKSLHLRVREIENDVSSRRERIKKLQAEAGLARDNSTLYAFQHQIETLNHEIAEADDEGLGLLEKISALESQEKTEAQKLEHEKRTFDSFLDNVAKESAEIRKEIEQLRTERQRIAPGIEAPLLDLYERLRASATKDPIAEVVNQTCQGCFTELTLNDFARARSGKHVVQCSACHRILVSPESNR